MKPFGWALGALALSIVIPARAQDYLQSSQFPLRIHYSTGAETRAADVLEAAEDAWSYQVVGLGFLPPPSDAGLHGSDDFDIVIEPTPYLGYTAATVEAADRPLGWASRIVLDPGLPDYVIPLIVSHEFHHAIQTGICPIGSNLGEAGAVLVSGIHRAGEAWYLTYSLGFNTFQQAPWKSVDWQAELGNYYPYGAALYLLFVDETRGDGTPLTTYGTLLSDLYTRTEVDGECASYLDLQRERFDVEDAYAEFARWRYFVGAEDDGQHFADLANWVAPNQSLESVALDADLDVSALPVEGAGFAEAPMEYGAAHVRLAVAGLAADERIQLSVAGDPAARWRVGVIRRSATTTEEDELVVPENGALTAELDPRGADRFVFAFINLGNGTHTDDGLDWQRASLTYSLERTMKQADPSSPEPPSPAQAEEPRSGCACAAAGQDRQLENWAAALCLLAIARMRRRR